MKIKIDGFEVEIKARAMYNKRASKKDTMDFLNRVSIWVGDAAETGKNERIKDIYKGISAEIYEQLEAEGCYD